MNGDRQERGGEGSGKVFLPVDLFDDASRKLIRI